MVKMVLKKKDLQNLFRIAHYENGCDNVFKKLYKNLVQIFKIQIRIVFSDCVFKDELLRTDKKVETSCYSK